MKVVLFSDLHLDAQFAWLGGQGTAARQRRQGLRETLRAVTSLVTKVRADALLCAGDLYEQERFSPDTAAFLANLFADLDSVPVFIAPGNHDWYGPESLYRQTPWSPNVHIFGERFLEPVELDSGLTLWGAAHCAPVNTDDFLADFHVNRAGVNLALFHGSERNWLVDQGEGKQLHASFDASEIRRAGLNHAFVGHYHKPKQGQELTYPGSPAPLAFGDGSDGAAVLITIGQDGSIKRESHKVSRLEMHDLHVNVTGCQSRDDIRDRVARQMAGCHGIARISLMGEISPSADFHADDLRDVTSNLEGTLVLTTDMHVAYDFEATANEQTVRGQFVRDVLDDASIDEDARHRILVTGLRALGGRDDLEVL